MADIGSIVTDHWGPLILATGALGTAAFGIVEGLKGWGRVGAAGFGKIPETLGPLMEALGVAYGPDVDRLLEGQYRQGRGTGDLPRTLRQGVRIGLTPENATALADFVGVVEGSLLKRAARELKKGEEMDPARRAVLGRFELAVDARIDAALALAEGRYVSVARVLASAIALVIAGVVGAALSGWAGLGLSILVGIAAVPLAPVAKDLVSALNAAAEALKARK